MSAAHPRSILSRLLVQGGGIVLTGSGTHHALIVPTDGVIENVRFQQATAGTSGTSWTVATNAAYRVRHGAADVALLTTAPVVTLAAGVGAGVDTSKRKDALATPSGCTKPVLAAGAVRVKKGDILRFNISTTGAYAPFPVAAIAVTIVPTP